MSVSSATVRVPAASAVATISAARYWASSRLRRNAPEPVFTSRTSACEPRGEFLAENGRADEAGALDGGGAVAESVEDAVGGNQGERLAHDGGAAFLENRFELRQGKRGAVAGDRLQLVERAAGVAQRASADHGDGETAGGGDGRHQKTGLVAHSARGVLVHGGAAQAAKH